METIKVLQLNAWTGRIKRALSDYFADNQFDIICLQEAIWAKDLAKDDVLTGLAVTVDQIKAITGLQYDSRAANWGIDVFGSEVLQGNAVLSRFKIVDEKIENVHGKYKTVTSSHDLFDHCYKAQFLKFENGLSVINYHGYWLTDPMGDETTVSTMHKVATVAKGIDGPVVMCGDLNVIHDSPAMRELDFLTDLTHKHRITNTLSKLSVYGEIACDHILINNQLEASSFIVSDEIISDHKPLIAELHF